MTTTDLELMLKGAAPPAPDALRERVRALRPGPRRRPVLARVAPRRLVLTACSAAAAGLLATAVVHGISADAPPSRATPLAGARDELQARGPVVGSAAPADAATSAPKRTAPAVTGRGRLTQAIAGMTLQVDGTDRLTRATSAATRIARSLGGYAESVEYVTPAGEPGHSLLQLRIPTTRVQEALTRLSTLGTVLSQELSTRDLERKLERETEQIAQLRREIRLLVAALHDPSITPVQRIELRVKLGEARRALAQRTHARKATISEGLLARVGVSITTGPVKSVVPHHQGRFDRMLGDAASFLALEGTIVLVALIVAAPLALLVFAAWAGRRVWRRREEQRLLATS
jgi:Domain of unknown function (DUF4349)